MTFVAHLLGEEDASTEPVISVGAALTTGPSRGIEALIAEASRCRIEIAWRSYQGER